MAVSQVKLQALAALGGMQIVVSNEMLVRQAYVSERVESEELAEQGALCGGHKACAVGSFLLGAGVKPTLTGSYFTLPEAQTKHWTGNDYTNARELFLNKPENAGLLLAYEALNAAAQELADQRGIDLNDSALFDGRANGLAEYGALESFFEFDGQYTVDQMSGEERKREEEEFTLSRFDLLFIIGRAAAIVEVA